MAMKALELGLQVITLEQFRAERDSVNGSEFLETSF